MKQYVERMFVERRDLKGKIRKEKETINKNPYGMDKTQKMLLAQQLTHMESYLDVLNQRIEYETKEKPNEIGY